MKRLIAIVSLILALTLTGCIADPIVVNTAETLTSSAPETTPETTAETTSDDGRIKYAINETLNAPHAKNALVYDFGTNTIIYAKNAEDKLYPASTTKLLTASVALKYVSADTVFTVGTEQQLVPAHSSLCFIKAGHRLSLEHLIYGMLLPSGNDAAYTIAVNVARAAANNTALSDGEAVSYFCSLMNEYAAEIGCMNSNFTSPDGWHDEAHYTTAYDLLLITLDALSHDLIAEAAAVQSKFVVFASGHEITWTNKNRLLDPTDEYYYEFAKGVKTGSTDESGKSLIALAEINGKKEITIVMGCEEDADRYDDTLALFHAILGD